MNHVKVIAYITDGDRLLVFRHTDFPEAGIQVPAGTVEEGEALDLAVLREAEEETGLAGLEIRSYLGQRAFDLSVYGQDLVQQRQLLGLSWKKILYQMDSCSLYQQRIECLL